MLKTQTHYPFVHVIAVLLAPLMFACSHANTELASTDGYQAVAVENNALVQPEVMDGFNTAPVPVEVTQEEISQAQKRVVKSKATHRKIVSPFTAVKETVKAPMKEVVREVATETPVVSAPVAAADLSNRTVVREGDVLNRYYFIRSGDTAESLAKLFYGSTEEASDLVKWNGPEAKWTTGQVVYYRSGDSAQDPSLLSYYFEAGIPTESITLKAGQTLESIAKEKLGSEKSWREIAAVNGLHEGDLLKEGTLVQYYSPSLDVKSLKGAKEQPKTASTDLAGFFTHNPLLVACTFVALVLFFGFLFVQRRRYRSRFDF